MPDELPMATPPDQILLTVIYDDGIDERVMEAIAACDVSGWTKVHGVHGLGGKGKKLDTPVWPGVNNVILLALSSEKATEVAEAVRALQGTYRRRPGITLWVQPITVL